MAEFPNHEMPEWGPDLAEPRPRRSKRAVIGEVLLAGPHLATLVYRLLRDPRVSRRRKLVLAGALAYVASPIDLIPGRFFPIVGKMDDALVAAFSVDYLMRGVEPTVLAELWGGSEDGLEMVMALMEWGSEFVPASLKRLVESGG